MRSVFKKYLPLMLCLLMIAVLTAGCAGPGQQKAWREKAEQHLAKLQKKVGDADHFTLRTEKAEAADKSTYAIFKADSETYGESFCLYVSRDGNNCDDDYYSLYLKDEAEERASAVLKGVLGDTDIQLQVSFLTMAGSHSEFSLCGADKLDDLLKKSLPSTPLTIKLKPAGEKNLSEETVDQILLALKADQLYCHIYPYISNALSFYVSNDGFSIMKQTGADAGAMMVLEAYEPSLSDSGSSPAGK